MAAFNLTPSEPFTFILLGIPDMEAAHVWIAIPIAMLYISGLLGNFALLFVVGHEHTLHKPMYLLLCMLAFTEIGTSTSVVPKTLCILWFNWKGITMGGCLTQMFFFHAGCMTHSAILVAMAFDRYMAICNPLRYTTILSNTCIAKLGLLAVIRAVLMYLPFPLLLQRLPFCANRIIRNTYCDHMSVAKLSCGDITVNSLYGLLITVIVSGSDLIFIALSYNLIIKAILKSTQKAHLKALNTCTAHLSVILTSYPLSYICSIIHRFGQGIVPQVHVILANLYFLLPPLLNPIVYGVKNKELCDRVGKYTHRR